MVTVLLDQQSLRNQMVLAVSLWVSSCLCNFFLIDASYNSITYGNLQKISKPNAKCEDPDETQALPSCNEHVSICSDELDLHGHMETSSCHGELACEELGRLSSFQAKWFPLPFLNNCCYSEDNSFYECPDAQVITNL